MFLLVISSLDAGATNIHVTAKYFPPSDFKLIKIKDDGHGFQKEDMPLACERFATSKLQSYDDLPSIKTFGFRGEALASISRIARVSIISRTKNSIVGYQMNYENGCPKTKEPATKASNCGTIISINDLFHNDKKRRNTLPNVSEEYGKIAELISLYSLDNIHVSFRLSKEGSSDDDVRTAGGEDLLTRVRNVLGTKVGNNLIPLKLSSSEFKFEVNGLFGDLNSNLKSYKTVIFVNKRLVECAPLKKAVEAIYKSRLSKGSCPFVLLSLNIRAMLDVNIHPTKEEVRFDYEEQVINAITNHIESALVEKTTSTIGPAQPSMKSLIKSPAITSSRPIALTPSSRPDLLNRSNHSIQTIDSMLKNQKTGSFVWRDIKLTSVCRLREELKEKMDQKIKNLLDESTYVGVYTRNSSILMQSGTSLYSIELEALT